MTDLELEQIRKELGVTNQKQMADLLQCDYVGYKRWATQTRMVPPYIERSAQMLLFVHREGLLSSFLEFCNGVETPRAGQGQHSSVGQVKSVNLRESTGMESGIKQGTLGEQMLANLKTERHQRLTSTKGREYDFKVIRQFFSLVQRHIKNSIENAEFPAPVRMTVEEQLSAQTFVWDRSAPGFKDEDELYPVWVEFLKWAQEEQITTTWKYCRNERCTESWWTLSVVNPLVPTKK